MLHALFKADIYARTYKTDFTDKIEHLAAAVTTGNTTSDAFHVFALEAGIGKSKYTQHVIDQDLSDWENHRTYLVVKRFKKDVEELEKALSHHNHPLHTKVLGITSGNWKKWQVKVDELKAIKVVIITHKRYMDLCLDDDLYRAFSESRQVLIIDEKVNFPVYSFSKKLYDDVRALLPQSIQGDYDQVCHGLLSELQVQSVDKKNTNKCIRIKPKINPATLDNFLQLMEVNMQNIKEQRKQNMIRSFLDGLQLWYSTTCVYHSGNISTCQPNHRLWGLQNNLILDASAKIDGVYHICNAYHIKEESKIIDHSDSTFYTIPFNTSKSNLQEHGDKFYKEISKKIQDYHSKHDQTLIVCHKQNYGKIYRHLLKLGININDIHIVRESNNTELESDGEKVTQGFAINWFGNLIGQNAYSDFTQCWIIGTPNIPYDHYLMHYMMYARKENLGNKSLDINHRERRFKNADFRKVQIGFIAAEIYQSIKRIQRNEKPNGEFFIINNDPEVIKMVFSQVKGSDNRQEIQLDYQQESKKEEKQDKVDELVNYLMKLSMGIYAKREIVQKLGLTNLSRLLNDSRVKDLIQIGCIKLHYKSIEKVKE